MHPYNLDATPEPGLLVAERRHRIVELLQEHGRSTVEALAARYARLRFGLPAEKDEIAEFEREVSRLAV